MPKIKIFNTEHIVPNVDNQSLNRFERNIKQSQLNLQGKAPIPRSTTPSQQKLQSPWWKRLNQLKSKPKSKSQNSASKLELLDARFKELDNIVVNYDQIIKLLQQHKNDYLQFFDKVSADVCLAIENKVQRIQVAETKRLTLLEKTRRPDIKVACQQQQEQIWKTVYKLSDAAVLALKKLELFKDSLEELADNNEQQKKVLIELMRDTQEIRDLYELQKELNTIIAEVDEMMDQALNLEKLLEPYLGPFSDIIKTVSRTDHKLIGAVREIESLTHNILSEKGMFTLEGGTEDKILDFLARATFNEQVMDYLTDWDLDAIPPTDFVLQNAAEADIGQALGNLQQFITLRFPKAAASLKTETNDVIEGEAWLNDARERLQNNTNHLGEPLSCFIDDLSSGGKAPEMVVIPAGDFQMSSTHHDDEQPIHQVNIDEAFAIGKYQVTFDDYDRYCEATNNNKPDDQGWGRGKQPVINVSWKEAVAYCQWLSEQTKRHYVLPSEAQWEYAARSGSTADYCFGDNEAELKNYAWYDDNSNSQTHPVGEKKPNVWGLYDVHGNVWEWCQDRWHDDYKQAPIDGSAWEKGNNKSRLLRGGSWYGLTNNCRAACRVYYVGNRGNGIGFRVSCVVAPRT